MPKLTKKPTKKKDKKLSKDAQYLKDQFNYELPTEIYNDRKEQHELYEKQGSYFRTNVYNLARGQWKWTEEDAPDLIKELEEYFKLKAELGEPPTLVGMALHLGVETGTLADWRNNRTSNPEVSRPTVIVEILRAAKMKCEEWVATNMLIGKAHPVASIFTLKNNFGWKDKMETDVTSNGESVINQPIVINMPKKEREIEGVVHESIAQNMKNMLDD